MHNVETADLYRCPSCDAVNLAAANEWCLCTNAEQTLVCAQCSCCFCDADAGWKRDFWQKASPELHTRRRDERSGTVRLQLVTETPERPVILLIDDDCTVHSIVLRVLDGFAGTLLHAYDGETGLRMAQDFQPELVITEALLPKIDGREIARTLKSDPATANGKVIVITGIYKGERYRSEAMREYLADDYIEKPVRADRLRVIIANLIGESSSRSRVARRSLRDLPGSG